MLEAAGLLGRESAASPVKRRATRRAAPSRPPRTALPDAPSMPEEEVEEVVSEEQQEERMEDAYDVRFSPFRLLRNADTESSVAAVPTSDARPASSPSSRLSRLHLFPSLLAHARLFSSLLTVPFDCNIRSQIRRSSFSREQLHLPRRRRDRKSVV